MQLNTKINSAQQTGRVWQFVDSQVIRGRNMGSSRTLVTLFRLWMRRFAMIISDWWIQTSSNFSEQEFKSIHRNIKSLVSPKQVQIPLNAK